MIILGLRDSDAAAIAELIHRERVRLQEKASRTPYSFNEWTEMNRDIETMRRLSRKFWRPLQ